MAVSGPHVLSPIAEEQLVSRRVAWRRWLRSVAAAAVLVTAVVAARLTWWQPAVIPVTAFAVQLGRVEAVVANNRAGAATARRRAELSPEIGGRVVRLPVKQGDRVRRGDLLLALSDADLMAQQHVHEQALAVARSAAVEACAQADLASRDLARAAALAADQLLSRQAHDQAETRWTTAAAACQTATAAVGQAAATLAAARVTSAKATLHAPFDGIVVKVSTEVGEWITPSPTGLFIPPVIDLFDDASMFVRAPLDEVDVSRVRAGLPVRITLDAYPGRAFDGRITGVGAAVSETQQQNRTVDVDVAFVDARFARSLLPGTSADIEIILEAKDHVLRVPTPAIQQGRRVLVVEGDMLVARTITTGLENWAFTEITGGLSAGDLVVTSLDRVEVREGARVRIEAETPR